MGFGAGMRSSMSYAVMYMTPVKPQGFSSGKTPSLRGKDLAYDSDVCKMERGQSREWPGL
jgi:hypothetical protein